VSKKPANAPPPLHPVEAEVMREVWRLGGSGNVRAVMESLNAHASKQRKYTTIMTIMGRLHAKGVLARHRDGKADTYTALLSSAQYAEARAQAQVGELVAEYGEVALVHFAKQIDALDPQRLDQLRRLAGRD